MSQPTLVELSGITSPRVGYGAPPCCRGCRYFWPGFNTPDGFEYDECRRGIWFPTKKRECAARRERVAAPPAAVATESQAE